MWMENDGGKQFRLHTLPEIAQLSPINGFVFDDLTGDGEKEVIALRDLSEDIEELGVRFRFRYFQDVEGNLRVPAGFEPYEIQVVAQAEGSNTSQAERTFEWQDLTER